ncbi:hypothetical protein ACFVJI_19030 [Streptomyces sp. NPDC127584]|uniref:hypothetical protein n=1 Tax=Streptomyces sp. NPDC127584 TaxID=3345403 RepID=UPI0036441BFA
MHPRRTTYLLLSVLLTTGCVAVPRPPSPDPPPGGPAPAAERPPVPVPAWPVPAQPVPHEEIAATEPLPGDPSGGPRARPGSGEQNGTGDASAIGRAPERRTAAPPARRSPRTEREAARPSTGRPRASAPPDRAAPCPKAPAVPAGGTPTMRRLCRQAQDIDAPMGAAELCRGMYGR